MIIVSIIKEVTRWRENGFLPVEYTTTRINHLQYRGKKKKGLTERKVGEKNTINKKRPGWIIGVHQRKQLCSVEMSSGGTGRGRDGVLAREKGCLRLAITGRKPQIKQREEKNKQEKAGKPETLMHLQRHLMGRGGNVHVTPKAPQFIRLFNNELTFMTHQLSWFWKLCWAQESGRYTWKVDQTWSSAWPTDQWKISDSPPRMFQLPYS